MGSLERTLAKTLEGNATSQSSMPLQRGRGCEAQAVVG